MVELHKQGSNNRYLVIDEQERHLKLKCVWFCNKEDLGDRIFCTHEGEEIWVAKYHSDHFISTLID